jgi:multimeric flavodoxin WrbA
MQTLYAEIESADVVVIGSPVYMEQVTGQTKVFMDRLLAFLNNDFSSRLKPGKRAILVFTQGQADVDTYADYFKATAKMFGILGLPVVQMLVAPNLLEHGAAADDENLLTNAALLGLQL